MKADINANYDYSIYSSLKIVRIENSYEKIDELRTFSRVSEGMQYHQSMSIAALYSEFLYSLQNPQNVVYQKVALTHYQRYPIEKQYTHAKGVFRKLQQMFELEGKLIVCESILYLATKRYLTLVYKQLYGNESTDNLSKSQFAFILPMFLEKDEQFISEILRPLLLEAGWISEFDLKSKLVFFGELEAVLYTKQQLLTRSHSIGVPKIMREKKYMCCSIQGDINSDSLTLTLDIVQMRFDKDFIAASRSSITSSSTQLLTPQFRFPSKAILIPNRISTKALGLPRFLLSRIFADSPGKISFVHGDLYGFYLKDKYIAGRVLLALIKSIIGFWLEVDTRYTLDDCIDKAIIKDSTLFSKLELNEKIKLTAIRYREILEFFPSIDTHRILDEIRKHAMEHELILHAADDVITTESKIYDTINGGMRDMCIDYHMLEIRKSLFDSFKSMHSFQLCSMEIPYNLTLGIIFKTLKMIELSSKLKYPIILSSQAIKDNLQLKDSSRGKTREETILERLPGYSFYVEAKITTNQQIRLYLHQVIETQNGKEKSTLSMTNTTIEMGDMFDTICDALWNTSQEHSSSVCASTLTVYDHYRNFKSRLLALLKEMFHDRISKEKDIHNLEDVRTGDAECSCYVQISHKMILDMGVKHYLKGIARSIIVSLKSPATFGKYKPKAIIITGSLLSEWTKLNNTLYRDFIWNQLEEELCLSLYQHQMKVYLIMKHSDVELFPDDKLIKWEKYQQVTGNRRILVAITAKAPSKLYKDKGDRYELVPAIEINGDDHWRFHLIHNDETPILEQSKILFRFYINPSKDSKEKFKSDDDAKSFIPYYHISAFLCSSQDQEDWFNPLNTLEHKLTIMRASLFLDSISLGDSYFLPDIGFPVVFTIGSQNYDFKTKCSLFTGAGDKDESLCIERITLKAISS